MKLRSSPVFAIASTTAIELASQPESLLLLVAGIIMTALVPLLHFHDFGEPGRIVRDGGLAYQLVIGTILAAFSVSSSIRRELDDGIALASLSKSISRTAFLFGKWLGACLGILRFWFASLAVTIVATRISPRFVEFDDGTMGYLSDGIAQTLLLLIPAIALLAAGFLHNRRRVRFCLVASDLVFWLSLAVLAASLIFNREWHFSPAFSNAPLAISGASFAILLAISTVCAFAAALASCLPAPAIAVAAASIITIGLSWDAFLASYPILYLLPMPNIQSLWLPDMLSADGFVSFRYLTFASLYSLSLSFSALVAGSIILDNADIR